MKGKLLGRGEIPGDGREYTRELYGQRMGGEAPFECDSCGELCRFGQVVVLVDDGSGYHGGCFDDAVLGPDPDYSVLEAIALYEGWIR